MPTKLDLKKSVSTNMGKTDWNTVNAVRDQKIDDALLEYGTSRKWNCAKKIVSVTFPWTFSDYSPAFDPARVYDGETTFTEVALEDIGTFEAGSYVYALDIENSQILSSETTGTVSYHAVDVPSSDSATLVYPDITALSDLATAKTWLASERDEDNYDRFMARYAKSYERAATRDARLGELKSRGNVLNGADLGWNRR